MERGEKRQRGKCTNTDNSRTIGFVLVFGLIALRRKTTQSIPMASSRKKSQTSRTNVDQTGPESSMK